MRGAEQLIAPLNCSSIVLQCMESYDQTGKTELLYEVHINFDEYYLLGQYNSKLMSRGLNYGAYIPKRQTWKISDFQFAGDDELPYCFSIRMRFQAAVKNDFIVDTAGGSAHKSVFVSGQLYIPWSYQ